MWACDVQIARADVISPWNTNHFSFGCSMEAPKHRDHVI